MLVIYIDLLCLARVTHVFIFFILFFFTDTATTEIYTLSLHDALPISRAGIELRPRILCPCCGRTTRDRRENSSTGVATTGIGTARQSRAKAQRGGEKQ